MADREYTVLNGNIRKDIEQVNAELQVAQSGIVVVISSLKAQRADLDPDIINVLEHHVSRLMFQQMERLEELAGSLPDNAIDLTGAAPVECDRVVSG